jgi:nucleoside-diphosphate-sugar epimerase
MAAKVSVTECERDQDVAFRTNVVDTLKHIKTFVAWAMTLGNTPTVVYVSSGHVYDTQQTEFISETYPIKPKSVYAQTKFEAESALIDLADRWKFPLIIARVFGLVAPRQREHYLLPSLIRRVRSRDSSPVPGLDNVRDYLDARDVCSVLGELALRRPEVPEVFNVCSGEPVSVRQVLACVVAGVMKHDGSIGYALPEGVPGREGDHMRLVGSNKKLVGVLGRQVHTISLNRTIKDALEASA